MRPTGNISRFTLEPEKGKKQNNRKSDCYKGFQLYMLIYLSSCKYVLVMIVLSLLIFETDFFSFFLVVLQLQVPSRDFQKHCHVMNLQTQ